MKIFPEYLVSDKDKKFSRFDESLIDKIIAGVVKSDPKVKFIESKHWREDNHKTWSDAIFSDGGEYNQMIISCFETGEKDFHYIFYKISEYNKKNFIHMDEMVDEYCSDTGYDFNDLNQFGDLIMIPNDLIALNNYY